MKLRYIVIVLLIIAGCIGFLSIELNRPLPNGRGWIGEFLRRTGIQEGEARHKKQIQQQMSALVEAVRSRQKPFEQQQSRDLQTQNREQDEALSEKILDTRERNRQTVEDNKRKVEEQKQLLQDRMRDQLRRIRDQAVDLKK